MLLWLGTSVSPSASAAASASSFVSGAACVAAIFASSSFAARCDASGPIARARTSAACSGTA